MAMVGSFSFGLDTTVDPSIERGIALGVDGNTNVLDEEGVVKVYGKFAVTDYFELVDGITAPAAATGKARMYVDVADGDLKIVFGDGTVKTIVVDT